MVTTTGVQAQHEGNRPRQFYAACENDGCGVCGPIRATEGAAHDDAREHAKVCSSADVDEPPTLSRMSDEPLGCCTVHGPYWTDECPPMLSEGSRTREVPPLPLGHVRAIEKAVELRAEENLSYAAIAVVMRRYHGLRRTPEWWLRQCRAAGAAPKYHGSQVYLRRGALFKIDEAVLAALSECPLTILQLRYKLGGNFDKLDRSLGRLIEAGRIISDGTGLERRWRPR